MLGARVAEMMGRSEEAAELYRRTLQVTPTTPMVWLAG
jgi:hypothetical protein